MRLARLLTALLASCALFACGEEAEPEPLPPIDCAWLANPNNCWRTTLEAATSCVPSEGTGSFDAANRVCTYASGHTVTFDEPLTLPLSDDPTWNFELASGGQSCLRLSQAESAMAETMTVTTSAGTFVQKVAGLGITFTCPDGSRFHAGNAFSLLSCEGGISDLPGTAWSSSDHSVSFSLLGGPSVFSCAKQ